jgi:hypothetical protein
VLVGVPRQHPDAQAAMLAVCTDAPHRAELKVVEGSVRCMPAALRAWAEARGVAYPITPQSAYYAQLALFLRAQPHWIHNPGWEEHLELPGYVGFEAVGPSAPNDSADDLSVSAATAAAGDASVDGTVLPAWRLRYVMVEMKLHVQQHSAASQRRPTYDAWQAELRALSARAPTSAAHVIQCVDTYWLTMAVQELMRHTALLVMAVSLTIGAFFVMLSTRSPMMAVLCSLTMGATFFCWAGLAQVSGMFSQGLGARRRTQHAHR